MDDIIGIPKYHKYFYHSIVLLRGATQIHFILGLDHACHECKDSIYGVIMSKVGGKLAILFSLFPKLGCGCM